MKYPLGYWTVGQRVLWRKPGREKWVPMTIREIILGECDRPIAARVQDALVDAFGQPSWIMPASFDDFYDPIQCPATDPRIINGAPIRYRLKFEDWEKLSDGDDWKNWRAGHCAEIFTGHGGVVGISVRLASGNLKTILAFKSQWEFCEPKPKKEKNERSH